MKPKKKHNKFNLRRDENPSNHERKENTIIYGLKFKIPKRTKKRLHNFYKQKLNLKLIKNTLILLGISLSFFFCIQK